MCISSEVVLDANAVLIMRKLADEKTAVFGACHNSVPRDLVVGAEPGLLVSSRMARPLGFICCLPAAKVRAIGGFDEDFMRGYWYDDDDFFKRLWDAGVDFLFDDAVHGVHLDHPRADLETPAGHEKIAANAALMARKHGSNHVWGALPRLESQPAAGQLLWEHP